MDDGLTVRCACGWETSGTEDAVVAATAEHGERLHNMRTTREQILAMAVPSAPPTAGGDPAAPPPLSRT